MPLDESKKAGTLLVFLIGYDQSSNRTRPKPTLRVTGAILNHEMETKVQTVFLLGYVQHTS